MTIRIRRGAVLLLVPLLLAGALLTGCRNEDNSLDRVLASGMLRIGLDPTYPPFEEAAGTNVVGLDADLAGDIAAGIGVTPAFSYFGYDGLYDALLTDQVDVLISALVISPERTRDFAYSRPYYDAGQVLVVPSASVLPGPDDLAGQHVAVELGALGHVQALTLARSQKELSVQPYPSTDEALQAVVDGQADAALVDSIGARLFLKAGDTLPSKLRILSPPVSSEPFAMVVRIEDVALLRQIDAELARMDENGRLAVLVARWLGP